MFDKLQAISTRYDELMRLLGDGGARADPGRYRTHSKALSEIRPVVEKFRDYRKVESEIADAREIAGGSDAGLRELAGRELAGLESRREDLLSGISGLAAFRRAVLRGIELAERVARHVEESPVLELMTPPRPASCASGSIRAAAGGRSTGSTAGCLPACSGRAARSCRRRGSGGGSRFRLCVINHSTTWTTSGRRWRRSSASAAGRRLEPGPPGPAPRRGPPAPPAAVRWRTGRYRVGSWAVGFPVVPLVDPRGAGAPRRCCD